MKAPQRLPNSIFVIPIESIEQMFVLQDMKRNSEQSTESSSAESCLDPMAAATTFNI